MNSFFLYFLALITSILIFYKELWILALFFILFIIYTFRKGFKNNRKEVMVVLIIFVAGIIRYLLCRIRIQYSGNIIGLVIYKKDNYFLLFNGLETFYVNSKEAIFDELDLIRINGSLDKTSFNTLESGFNFGKYLANKGVERQIYIKESEVIFDFPIQYSLYKNWVTRNIINNEVKSLVDGLLFNGFDRTSNVAYSFKSINIVILLSFSGIYINYFIRFLKNLLSYKFSDKKTDFIILVILFPLLLINITNLVMWRVLLVFLFRSISVHFFDAKIPKITQISIIGIVILLFNPFNLFQKSFYISFLISVFLSFSSLYLMKFKRWKRTIMSLFLVFLVILPFNLDSNNCLNLCSSILVFVLTIVLKPLFLISLLLLVGIKLPFFENITVFILKIISKINVSIFNINIPTLGVLGIILYFLILIIIYFFSEINLNKPVKIATICSICAFVLYSLPIQNFYTMEVNFINVGQGDSTLIRYKNDSILIDTGGLTYTDLATNNLIPFLRSKRIYNIDHLFITHKDYDHNGAASSLIKYFKVNKISDYNSVFPITIGKLVFNNLNNYPDLFDEENDKSLVISLNYEDKKFLFMGDAPIKIEKEIIKDNPNLRCDILKIGHHGSKTSSCEEFIRKVRPKDAIISCGHNNKFGHPNDVVIKLLKKYDINIRRTDIEGTIMYKFYI